MNRKKRWAYLDDFQKNKDGEFVYMGKLHRYTTKGISRVRAFVTLWVLGLAALAGVITGGCIPVSGMEQTAYVVLPYSAAVIAVVWLLWGLGVGTFGKDPMRDYNYRKSVRQFKLRGIVSVVCIAAALLGEIVYLFLNGAGDTVKGTVLFLVSLAVSLASMLGWLKFSSRLTWKVEK